MYVQEIIESMMKVFTGLTAHSSDDVLKQARPLDLHVLASLAGIHGDAVLLHLQSGLLYAVVGLQHGVGCVQHLLVVNTGLW